MKTRIIFIVMGIFMYTHPLYSQFESNGWQWMKQYCGIEPFNGGTNNRIIDVAFDSVGDIYILGKFSQGAELDGEDLCGEISNSDSPIMLFAKISKQTGRIIWKKRIASSGASIGNPTFILKNNKLTLFAINFDKEGLPVKFCFVEFAKNFVKQKLLKASLAEDQYQFLTLPHP